MLKYQNHINLMVANCHDNLKSIIIKRIIYQGNHIYGTLIFLQICRYFIIWLLFNYLIFDNFKILIFYILPTICMINR